MNWLSGVVMALGLMLGGAGLGGCAVVSQETGNDESVSDDSELTSTPRSLTITLPSLRQGQSYVFQVSSDGKFLSGKVTSATPTGLGTDTRNGPATLAVTFDSRGGLRLLSGNGMSEAPGPDGFRIRIFGITIIDLRIIIPTTIVIP